MPKENPVLNIKQAAEYFGIHPLTCQRYCREGKIPAFKIGSGWHFHRKRLEKWVKQHSLRQGLPQDGKKALL